MKSMSDMHAVVRVSCHLLVFTLLESPALQCHEQKFMGRFKNLIVRDLPHATLGEVLQDVLSLSQKRPHAQMCRIDLSSMLDFSQSAMAFLQLSRAIPVRCSSCCYWLQTQSGSSLGRRPATEHVIYHHMLKVHACADRQGRMAKAHNILTTT